MNQYCIIYEIRAKNWYAYVPALPGCSAEGKTFREIKQQIREAINNYLG
jgi:predicted RNase H-like HicB family nuclease